MTSDICDVGQLAGRSSLMARWLKLWWSELEWWHLTATANHVQSRTNHKDEVSAYSHLWVVFIWLVFLFSYYHL